MLSVFRRKPASASSAMGLAGSRAYAIGDVHGQLDLLNDLLVRIEKDARGRKAAKTFVVLLGDLVDRGPDSCGVIERLRTWRPDFARPVFLMGNHEEFFLDVLDGSIGTVSNWLSHGGRELAMSYGIGEIWLEHASPQAIAQEIYRKVPAAHRDFISGFGDSFRFGDYLFVHAGIRPGVALEDQVPRDMRWIREAFLDDRTDHGVIVVHGHTIVPVVDERANRIGIDTGAYKGGPLTAIAIEGEERWYLEAIN